MNNIVETAETKGSILIIDNNRSLNSIYYTALEEMGYAVNSLFTLAEARQRLKSTRPDVIVMEVNLPDGSGIDFCREIRETVSAHIIFLTMANGASVELECVKAGADSFLRKPYSPELLTLRVGNSLRQYVPEGKTVPEAENQVLRSYPRRWFAAAVEKGKANYDTPVLITKSLNRWINSLPSGCADVILYDGGGAYGEH